MKEFNLKIELVPSTAWNLSIYKTLKNNNQESIWKEIKEEIFGKEGKKCWICGKENCRLEAHEFWEYDDKNHIQKLMDIHHLCNLCHKIKHIGFWCHTLDGKKKLNEEGLDKIDLINHFCEINNCSEIEFKKHEEEAFKIFDDRSQHKWKQDFGKFKSQSLNIPFLLYFIQ